MKSKQLLFADLVERVQNCNLCPRMNLRRRVLSTSNGNLDAPIVFIAEAPGRLGADKCGIPLSGDQTARNFDWLISKAGIDRADVFITNAVLCNPRKPDGNNDSPSSAETRNCSRYLKEALDIIRPKYVAPLGKTALSALSIISPLDVKLSDGVGQVFRWNGYQIYPLYHPGPRAFIWRPKMQQRSDYEVLAGLLGVNSCRLQDEGVT